MFGYLIHKNGIFAISKVIFFGTNIVRKDKVV